MRRYAEIVRERAILRKLIAASDEIATSAFNPQGRAGVADPRRGRGQDLQDRRGRLAPAARASRAWTSWWCALIDRVQRTARERRRGSDRRAHRLLRPRPHDRRPAEGRPDRAGGAAVDGQDRVRAEHRRARGGAAKACRCWCSRWKWAPRSWRCAWSARSAASTSSTCAPGALRRRRMGAPDRGGRASSARCSMFIDETPALTPAELRARARRMARQLRHAGPDRHRLPAADERLAAAATRTAPPRSARSRAA